jgi:hypothetical protein
MGHMVKAGKDYVSYQVVGVKNLKVLINHLEKYPLITQKHGDYVIFKLIVELISKKEHLNVTGLNKIVGLKASMNRGLSPELKAAFPEVTPEKRLIINEQIKDPY